MRHLISLGVRCDTAFQLRMHSGDNTAHFFDWLSTPTRGLIEIFRRDFDVFAPDDLVYVTQKPQKGPGYVLDTRTGVLFHHQFPIYGQSMTPQFLLHYQPFAAKFRHLAERFRDYVRKRPVTLVRRDISEKHARKLERAFFKLFPGADVRFLYLNRKDIFETNYGRARLLPDGPLTLGDPIIWASLLGEEGLIDTPYRLTATDILGFDDDVHNMSPDDRFSPEHYAEALRHNPQSALFRYEMSRRIQAEDEDTALRLLDEAVDLAPGNATIRKAQIILARARDIIPADEAVAKLRELETRHEEAGLSLVLADSLLQARAFAEAVTFYDKHLRVRPLDSGAYRDKAWCLHELGEYQAAERVIDVSLMLRPDLSHSHTVRAFILAKLEKWAESKAAMEIAIALDPAAQPQADYLMAKMAETGIAQPAAAEAEMRPEKSGWFKTLFAPKTA